MNWDAVSFDWNQVRAFLATVEEGSLSAAARLSLSASGQSQAVEGHVSITATDMTATYLLPSVLAQLRDVAPNISIELIPSNDVRDLIKREADIAIRHVRPEQPDLIAKRIGSSSAHLYASKLWLDRVGHPENVEDLPTFSFVGMSPIERFLPATSVAGLELKAEQFKVTTASGTALMELVRLGLGLASFHVTQQSCFLIWSRCYKTAFRSLFPCGWLLTESFVPASVSESFMIF